ncbi:MAG: hypothetical protein JNL70_06115 [Saprospiraceae bacterium]|nr:hypothetical protein [Saprospiraceae bacterium]
MKNLILLFLSTLFISACGQNKSQTASSKSSVATAQRDTLVGIKGCESAKCEETTTGRNYSYAKHKIKTVLSEEGVGEEIYVFTEGVKDTFWIENIDAHHFYGIKDNLMFVDNGTGPNGRSLLIYDLKNRKPVHEARYETEMRFEQNKLIYMTPLDTRNLRLAASVCPDREKWEKQGLSFGYGQYISFDLSSHEAEERGEYTCYPIQ